MTRHTHACPCVLWSNTLLVKPYRYLTSYITVQCCGALLAPWNQCSDIPLVTCMCPFEGGGFCVSVKYAHYVGQVCSLCGTLLGIGSGFCWCVCWHVRSVCEVSGNNIMQSPIVCRRLVLIMWHFWRPWLLLVCVLSVSQYVRSVGMITSVLGPTLKL